MRKSFFLPFLLMGFLSFSVQVYATDTDNDGLSDSEETAAGYNPNLYTRFVYVNNAQADDSGNGLTPATAKKTLSAAITISQTNNENVILVAAGTYSGTANKNLSFGGSNIKLRSIDGAAATIIDLQNDGRFLCLSSGENLGSWLDGFTIKNGNSDTGGAVYLYNSKLRIKNTVFEENSNYSTYYWLSGSVIYAVAAEFELTNCKFINNRCPETFYIPEWDYYDYCYSQGVVYAASSTVSAVECEFNSNAVGTGASIFLSGSTANINKCRFLNNTSYSDAGVLYIDGNSSVNMVNCLVKGNSSKSCNAFMALYYGSADMFNCTVADCSTTYGSDVTIYGTLNMTNTIFRAGMSGAPASVNSCCTSVDCSAYGSNNFMTDPLLDRYGYPQSLSPCIDAGVSSGAPATDISGINRPAGNGIDIGCFEFKDSDSDGIPDWFEIAHGLDPNDPDDAALSKMNDGISNLNKYLNGMNPDSTDSDGDGISDAAELAAGYDPAVYTAVIYVDAARADDSGDGLSPATAKKTIGAAVTASKYSGKQHVISVAAGTYSGSGNKNLDFSGYDIKLRSASGAASTIIDLENSGRFIYLHSGESYQSSIDGFTIRSGSADYGAALRFDSAQAVVKNCIFEHNSVNGYGGAIYVNLRPLQVINCIFASNSAYHGGGLWLSNSTGSEFKNCEFTGNWSVSYGGVLFLRGGSQTMECCRFLRNQSGADGGVAYADYGANLTLTNSLMLNNRASGNYSELDMAGGNDSLAMTNVTIAGGTSSSGVSCQFSCPATLTNNIILSNITWAGTFTANNNCSPTDLSGNGSGNITSDPQLTVAGYLKSTSPCIDAGTSTGAPAVDIDGETRPAGSAVDIGCQEFKDSDSDGIPDNVEIAAGLNPYDSGDAALSKMNDGISNLNKYLNGMNPGSADADNDGISDAAELAAGYDPLIYTEVIYVDGTNGLDFNSGLTVTAAKQTIGAAVTASKFAGKQHVIMVAAGTYAGSDNKNLDFGGYDIMLRSADGAAATVIDLENSGRFVYLHTWESYQSCIDGFTVRNGNADYGAALRFDSAQAVVKNCVFERNSVNGYGGAIYVNACPLRAANCKFISNQAYHGGSMWLSNSNGSEFKNCEFTDNQSTSYGGVMFLRNVVQTMENCKFTGNMSHSDCGVAYTDYGTNLTLANCLFLNNYADGSFSELHTGGGSDNITMTNVTITGSSSIDGTSCQFEGPAALTNNIIQGNIGVGWNCALNANNNCTWTDLSTYGSGNINSDPQLTINGYLKSGSPCIDAGTSVGAPATDMDGVVRPAGNGIDIGCREFKDTDGDGIPDNVEIAAGLNPYDPNDAALSKMNDGISNLDKYLNGMNPGSADSDGDGIADAAELAQGYDPAVYTEVIYVDASRPDDNGNGLTLATAKKSIGAAVAASKYSGKQHVIMVAAGTYAGSDNRNLDFSGYNIKLRSVSGAMTTIIDLENSGRFAYFHTGETNQSWIEGFTIKNGYSDNGGAIQFYNAQAIVKNCVFSNNSVYGAGGAIYVYSRPLQITNCEFTGNSADEGGALSYISSSGSDLKGCEFTGNQASGGGALLVQSGSVNVSCDRFQGNKVSSGGGAILTRFGANLTLTNSLLLNNHANGSYSDICRENETAGVLTITNVTIASGSSYTGISCRLDGQTVLTNNIIQGNIIRNDGTGALTANNNCSSTNLSAYGTSNIMSDPLLTVNGYLKSTSPCIDAGTATGAPTVDIDGVARPAGSGVDIGCQEFKDTDSDGIPDNVETAAGLNPNDPSDAALSKMNDGISNLDKYLNGMNPGSTDSDGDGISDAAELAQGYNPSVYTEVIYVDGVNGSDSSNGLTLAAAKQTIGAAVTASKTAGKEHVIMVAAGTYTGSDNKNLDFGGYDIKLRSADGAAATVIDLENSGRFLYLHLGESNQSRIDGFTVKNGNSDYGAGIQFYNAQAIVKNCVFEHNTVNGAGGAIYAYGRPLQVTSCKFLSNSADEGGGMGYVNSSGSELKNCEFTGNQADGGGAILTQSSSVNMSADRFLGNQANTSGAILVRWGGQLTLTNSLLLNNHANNNYSVICKYNDNDGSIVMTNVTIAGGSSYYGEDCHLDGPVTLTNNIIQCNISRMTGNNTLVANNNCSWTDLSANGSGNIMSNPQLTVNGYLKSGSPCIDAGTAIGAPAVDIDGVIRPAGNAVDIGCQEFKDTDYDGIPDNVEIAAGLNPYDPSDAALSKMNDGISNLDKYLNGMNPGSVDSDGDGIPDATELAQGYNSSVYTEIIYVDGVNGADTNNGLSLATAKQTIGAAVAASKTAGKEHVIMVAAGTYTGSDNKNLDFGGYDIKLRSASGAAFTTIDLENSGRFLFLHLGESNQSCLDGFTVKNGNTTEGGAIQFYNAQAIVKNCVFASNSSSSDGGAIYAYGRPLQVTNCKFICNQSSGYTGGGAMYYFNSSGSELKGCEFTGNQASVGGALVIFNSSVNVSGTRILMNQASTGGAIYLYYSGAMTMTNSLLLNNHANGNFSDICSGNGIVSVVNSTISGGSSYGGISCWFNGPTTLTNNIIQGNAGIDWSGSLTANNNCSTTNLNTYGSGNIMSDPQLTVAGYLKSTSPCIDAGTSTGAPAFDIDGVIRPAGNTVDIGCQEFKDTDSDGIPDNVETAAGLNPYDPSDAALSKMNDGISNLDKYLNGMNPGSTDSDGDGISDAAELANDFDPSVYTEVIYVDTARPDDSGSGLTPATAKKTIGAAVTLSKFPGKEHVIVVAPGTYAGSNNKNLDFSGYDIKLHSASGAASTEIDLQNSGRFISLHLGESNRSWINGFTIKNGSNSCGGVVYLTNSGLTIKNCIITENESPDSAGVAYVTYGSLVIEKTTVNTNKANDFGGAIYALNSKVKIAQSSFNGNKTNSGGYGGVIYAANSNVEAAQTYFNANSAKAGGAVAISNTIYYTVNCAYMNNAAIDFGHAFHAANNSTLTAVNCSVSSSDSANIAGIYNDASIDFKNCIIQDKIDGSGAKNINYCCSSITDYTQTGSGNMYTDPMLSIVGYLLPDSPCIDAGTADGAPVVDIIGQARPAGIGVDIGCEEYADSNNNGLSDHFEKLCGGSVSAGGDITGDGLSNLYKFQHGLNPLKKDTDRDGMSDKWEIDHGLNPYKNDALSDEDLDGLLNIEEYLAGSDPDNPDTDSDNMGDPWEVNEACSDPTAADFDGTETTVLTQTGNNYTNTFSGWDVEGTVVFARDRAGWIEYTLNVPQQGVYVIEVTGSQHTEGAIVNDFKIGCYVNGAFSSYQTLNAAYGNTGSARFFTPVLTPGNATVRLGWENVYRNTSLQINSLKLIRLGGVDANANGIPDWVESRLDNMSKIKLPETSKVSPVCVEGEKATFFEEIAIDGFYTPEGETPVPPVIKHAAFNRWYADVVLNPDAASDIAVSIQAGAKVTTKQVTWVPTNVFTDDETITIRMNDSLRLTAVPVGGVNGTVSITVEGQTLDVTDGVPVPYKFANAGDIYVTATYIPAAGDPVTRYITVKVVSASFAGNPACFINTGHDWYNPNIGGEIILEADRNISFTDYGMTAAGRRIYLCANSMATAYVDARIYENGPIIDNARIDMLEATCHTADGFHQILYTFEDGSVLYDGYVILNKVPADVQVVVVLWGGSLFEDGTTTKTFTAASFNANGEMHYNILGPPGFHTCQSVLLYQNGVCIRQM